MNTKKKKKEIIYRYLSYLFIISVGLTDRDSCLTKINIWYYRDESKGYNKIKITIDGNY